MSRNLYKTLQKKVNKKTDEDLAAAGAEFITCKFGARYAKTDKAVWMWHSLSQNWNVLYGHKYNHIDEKWKSLREHLGESKSKARKTRKSKASSKLQEYTIEIEGIKYRNQADACKQLGLGPGKVSNRIKSDSFPDWKKL
ncbi:hypothetical protein N9N32_00275 [Alphaproteobacteria bacterium]|nr:hypothetical protein [Alphaproteobacteria bacterium]